MTDNNTTDAPPGFVTANVHLLIYKELETARAQLTDATHFAGRLAIQVNRLETENKKLRAIHEALKTQRANPHSARAQLELDNALKAAQ